MDRILNFEEALDVNLLDQVVSSMYEGNPDQIARANEVLMRFQEDERAWTRVDTILQFSQYENTKILALTILKDTIASRWKVLAPEQKAGIKNFIEELVIRLTSDENTLKEQQIYINKLNLVLVQILVHEWPHNWPSFVPDIVAASKTNESLCENNMAILKLLSEEIFDFSRDQMMSQKVQELKSSLNEQFSHIYTLCEYILENAQKPSLVAVTLETLLRFLNWIPLGYIFETQMIQSLLFKFFPVALVRNVSLQCLMEIAGMKAGDIYSVHMVQLFEAFMAQLRSIIPLQVDFAEAYATGTAEEQAFLQYLALFLTSYFKNNLALLEASYDKHELLVEGHHLVARLTAVPSDSIFRVCLEYWHQLANNLYVGERVPDGVLMLSQQQRSGRRELYANILSNVRLVMIQRMAKPEEVLVVQDETGEVRQERTKDTAALSLYKHMRDTLIFLTHLDPEDTERIMNERLQMQISGREWSWHAINTLCWAIGSISGATTEDQEKRFLVRVIKNLLDLVGMKRGKDNKAVIASDIMYIVGQYPRFLRAHWKFLRTVVNKLFEFMHEPHPGVKDMATETFVKIAQKCKRKFVITQEHETRPFIEEIIEKLQQTTSDLDPNQLQTFYEGVGYMINSQPDVDVRTNLIAALFAWPNDMWMNIMGSAAQNLSFLQEVEVMKAVANIIRTNMRACVSLRHPYISQLNVIYMDMLNVYRCYSEMIANLVQTYGPNAITRYEVKYMRAVKRETLRLIETFVERSEDPQLIVNEFMPPLMEAVLRDYKENQYAREAEVLSLMTAMVTHLKENITNEVPRILDAVFECTLMMITPNEDDFPEIRTNFFTLLRTINNHCFPAFFMVPEQVFKYIVDSMIFAMKHVKPELGEIGANSLLELLARVETSEVAQPFFQTYLLTLIHECFVVLTDTLHKQGFKLQATLMCNIFHHVEMDHVQVPLFDTNQYPNYSNQQFLREFTIDTLANAFNNLQRNEIERAVLMMFNMHTDVTAFKNHMRDFLISLKTFSSSDNSDLFLEEKLKDEEQKNDEMNRQNMHIPGLAPENEEAISYAESNIYDPEYQAFDPSQYEGDMQ